MIQPRRAAPLRLGSRAHACSPPFFWGKRLNKQILPNCGEGEAKAAGTLLPGSFVPLGVTQEKPRLLHALVRRFGGERERERERERSAPRGCWQWAEVPNEHLFGCSVTAAVLSAAPRAGMGIAPACPPHPHPHKSHGNPLGTAI